MDKGPVITVLQDRLAECIQAKATEEARVLAGHPFAKERLAIVTKNLKKVQVAIKALNA